MDPSLARVAEFQRKSLDFMLTTLGLPPAPSEPPALARVFELECQVTAVLAENRRLRREVAALERELHPEEADRDAFEREMDSRLARERERRAEG